jgi:hypothetical protein
MNVIQKLDVMPKIASCRSYRFFFVLLFCGYAFFAGAQTYRTAVGLRVGTEFGLTIQQKIWNTVTAEGILTTNQDRWQSQAIIEYHSKIIGRRINMVTGIGPHYGESTDQGSYAGITPIFGFEATLFGFNFTYDYKPSFNVFHGQQRIYHDSGLSIRVVLLKEKKSGAIRDLFN